MRGGQGEIRSVNYLGYQRAAADHSDGLAAMIGFVASADACFPRLGASQVFGTREFVTAVIDDIMTAQTLYNLRPQLLNFDLNGENRQDHECLHDIGGNHDSQRDQSEGGFAGQPGLGAGKRRFDRGDKILPTRRPFHLQLGHVVTRLTDDNNFLDLESLAHFGRVLRVGGVMSIVSPISVFVSQTF